MENKYNLKEISTNRRTSKSTWIAFLPFIYFITFMLVGIFLVWSDVLEFASTEVETHYWVTVLLSSIFYLVVGLLGFFLVSAFTLYRLIRDKALLLALQRHWPLLIAILYFFIPNLPGPIDEILVSTIVCALATYFGLRERVEQKVSSHSSYSNS